MTTTHPRHRRTDPVTSREAADRVESFAASHIRLILREVVREPGLTACEIAEKTGLERHAPSRRLPEMRREGLVENGLRRRCTVKGSNQQTWLPTPAGEKECRRG